MPTDSAVYGCSSAAAGGVHSALLPDPMHVISGLIDHAIKWLYKTIDALWLRSACNGAVPAAGPSAAQRRAGKAASRRARNALDDRIAAVPPFTNVAGRHHRRFRNGLRGGHGMTCTALRQVVFHVLAVTATDNCILPAVGGGAPRAAVLRALESLHGLVELFSKETMTPAEVGAFCQARVQ
jgi:hypothetical protein